jgi:hypothetical protein
MALLLCRRQLCDRPCNQAVRRLPIFTRELVAPTAGLVTTLGDNKELADAGDLPLHYGDGLQMG